MTIITTTRLRIRRAVTADAGLFQALWNDPRVMAHVGFPRGLGLTRRQIIGQLASQPAGDLDVLLVVERRADGVALGECKLGAPDEQGQSEIDIKLLPEFWRRGYGTEVAVALLEHLFTRTACRVVQATPNKDNRASIRLQEAVGGVRVGEGVFTFLPHLEESTTPVPHYIFHVTRSTWLARRAPGGQSSPGGEQNAEGYAG